MINPYSLTLELTKGNVIKTNLEGTNVKISSIFALKKPKYLNSPESEIFEKGKMLFAFEKASSNIRKRDKAIIVEGYFDVIALHSKGITNSVASLGTALNKYQISQLCRCTDNKNIILNFDSDNAGILATKRVIKNKNIYYLNIFMMKKVQSYLIKLQILKNITQQIKS